MNNSDVYSERLQNRNFNLNIDTLPIFNENADRGEITGEDFVFDVIDKGMPIRGNYSASHNDKKQSIDMAANNFSIYDKSNMKPRKLDYFDPNEGSGYANVKAIDQIDQTNEYSNIIDCAGMFLFNEIYNNIQNTFAIMPFSFVNILCCLYVASRNDTTKELKKYLSLLPKPKIYNNLQIFSNYMKSIKYINLSQFIILPYSTNINKNYISQIAQLKILQYSTQNMADHESIKINKYIASVNKTNYTHIIQPHHISFNNKQSNPIICLITGTITPVWKVNFDGYYVGTFGSKNRKQTYLVAQNKEFNYYSDDNTKLIQFDSYDDKMSFGIIQSDLPIFSVEEISIIIDKSEPQMFSQVVIPQIRQDFSMRYTNLMKASNMKTIFTDCEIPECINSNVYINDVVQNITISIDKNDTKNNKNHSNQNNHKYTIKYRVMSSFMFYVKLNELNTFLCLGYYY